MPALPPLRWRRWRIVFLIAAELAFGQLVPRIHLKRNSLLRNKVNETHNLRKIRALDFSTFSGLFQ